MGRIRIQTNETIAISLFLFVFTVYFFISAPTISFWDCSEYAAAGYSLGVPHPPGNPLYMLLCRSFCVLLPFIHDVARRMTLISVLSVAVTAMLVYLSVKRVLDGWIGVLDTRWKKLVVYIGAVTGSLFASFGSTVLFSSVEAEVNTPLLVPLMLCTWLAIVWAQSRNPRRDRYLLLMAYISFLGIGIHMYSMITLGPVFLFIILTDREKLKDWRLWITSTVSGMVIYSISLFIWLGLSLVLVTLIFSFTDIKNKKKWRFCFWLVTLALLGFSCHLYLPIRSALNPMIDENHPATWQAFNDYLERKQYGSESMISRMSWRRGTWAHQLGIDGHMGFGGFFITQFFKFSPSDTQESLFSAGAGPGTAKLLIYLIPLSVMLAGMYYLLRKNWKTAVFLISLEIATTLGLVLYMNFADGTRPERLDYISWSRAGRPGPMPVVYREVRVRDYFFIAGFMYHGMWIGIAAGALLYSMYTSRKKIIRTTLSPVCTLLCAVSPALPMSQNIPFYNRMNDRLPFEYAYNLLMSCDREGILFTNGDNDTFPLWALQEAYGIRRDVRIVNLSLLNTDWYIKQLRDLEPKVPISFNDKQIDELRPERNPMKEPLPYNLANAGITVTIPSASQKNAILLQDKMILNIVNSNRWRKPVYFSTTVSENNFIGLKPYMRMEGLVYRIMPKSVSPGEEFDLEKSLFLINKVYKFSPKTAMIEENSQMILSNYAACFIQTAFAIKRRMAELSTRMYDLEKRGLEPADSAAALVLMEQRHAYKKQLDTVLNILDQAVSLIPWDWRSRAFRHEFLVEHTLLDEAEKRAQEALLVEPGNNRYLAMMSQISEIREKKKTEIKGRRDSAAPRPSL